MSSPSHPSPEGAAETPDAPRATRRRGVSLPVGRRIACVTGALLALTGIAVGVAVSKTSAAKTEIAEASELTALAVEGGRFSDEMELQRGLQSEFVLLGDEKILKNFEESAERAFAIADKLEARFPENPVIVEAIRTARALDEKHDPLVLGQIAPAVRRGDAETARRLLPQAIEYVIQFKQTGDLAATEIRRLADAKQQAASAAVDSARTLTLLVGGLALLVGTLLSFLLARSITKPLARLRDASDRAAEGDLTVQVGNDSKDEVGQVSRAFDGMLMNFRDIVGRVSDAAKSQTQAAKEMAEASQQSGQAVGQIAATVEDIARGASEQAEGTQRVTSTVDEMARGVAQVAEGGQAASAAAAEADQAAENGNLVVAEATEAIERISERVEDAAGVVTGLGEKGQAIGEIVGTIDQIASQTNLLALNAAIEAARAGEQGRGFAVVAEEVRQLAEESQKAAASIGEIIRDIQHETGRAVEAMAAGRTEVQAGVESVSKAGEAFGQIREQVERVSGEVTQVAAAAQELEAGALQVQEQIAAVAAVSEENAAAAQEVAASTEETTASTEQVSASASTLADDAAKLAEVVARFTV